MFRIFCQAKGRTVSRLLILTLVTTLSTLLNLVIKEKMTPLQRRQLRARLVAVRNLLNGTIAGLLP
jgi:hypothetical protein